MTVLSVPSMRCKNCVARITKALSEAKLDYSVSLDDKTVTINGDDNAVKTAISELDDLGFDAAAKN
ncbi:MAG: heavy metal-associated domain-containing protein [Oscillospiraceae bacterium]